MKGNFISKPTELGKVFRKERVAVGKTQAQVAAEIGCRRQTIVDLEAGKNVTTKTLMGALLTIGKRIEITSNRPSLEQLPILFGEEDED